MRRLLALAMLVGCFGERTDLEWVAPIARAELPIGDAIELAVATTHPDVRAVRFLLDGVELAVCDPAQPEEDCRRDDTWRWTTVLARQGVHELAAVALDASGEELDAVVRPVRVVRELLPDDVEVETSLTLGESNAGAPEDLPALAAAGRGVLDPDRPFHRMYGGIEWRVANQRVRLRDGTPQGSVAEVRRCMERFGSSIRRWADHYQISRASVVATALTESNCTNPAGSSDGLSSGPMQVTASTCAAITGLARATCRARMHSRPDFSFQVGAKYMGSSYQRDQHRRDPPKIAAAYNAGSLRATSANRWHMVSTGNHIDRFVRHYNAYRAWESQ